MRIISIILFIIGIIFGASSSTIMLTPTRHAGNTPTLGRTNGFEVPNFMRAKADYTNAP